MNFFFIFWTFFLFIKKSELKPEKLSLLKKKTHHTQKTVIITADCCLKPSKSNYTAYRLYINSYLQRSSQCIWDDRLWWR